MARTIQDLMDLTPADLSRMNEAALRDITQQMASAANKRLKRLKTEGLEKYSPAARSAMNRQGIGTRAGGAFSVRVEPKEGDTKRNALLHEFADARRFMAMKTSSVKGTKKLIKQRDEAFGDKGAFGRPEPKKTKSGKIKTPSASKIKQAQKNEQEFWSLFQKLSELNPNFVNEHYDQIKQSLYAIKFKKNPYEVQKMLNEITMHNVSKKRRKKEEYAKGLAEGYMYLDENHHRKTYSINDDDDILDLFQMYMTAKYENEQDTVRKELEGKYRDLL